jgi:hypothetical protein
MARSPSLEGMSNIGSPVGSPSGPSGNDGSANAMTSALDLGPPASQGQSEEAQARGSGKDVDQMPMTDGSTAAVSNGQVVDGEDDKTK